MKVHEIRLRVRYGETDQMGVVYHGSFVEYFEVGRVEWLRSVGATYKKMEEEGVMLPVVNLNINYKKPAKYDDLLTIRTRVRTEPTYKIIFDYEVLNESNELLSTAETTLVFVNMETGKPIMCPEDLLQKIMS